MEEIESYEIFWIFEMLQNRIFEKLQKLEFWKRLKNLEEIFAKLQDLKMLKFLYSLEKFIAKVPSLQNF